MRRIALKRFCYFILLLIVALAGLAYGYSVLHPQSPEPRSILEKAIEAHGGAKNIGKSRMGTLKGKTQGGDEMTMEETFDLPKRWKRVTSGIINGKRRVAFTLMIEGNLWQWDEGMKPQQTPNLENAQAYFTGVSVLLD